METRIPAEVFVPGEFIKEELEYREWTQNDLADILGKTGRFVSDIINGKNSITPTTAISLGQVFGTSAEYWLNLESVYQLAKAAKPDDTLIRRSKLYSKAPVKDMIKRGWIERSENIAVLEKRILDFLQIDTVDDEPQLIAYAARKSTSYADATPAQIAWFFRARHLAELVTAERFSFDRFDQVVAQLKLLRGEPAKAQYVSKVLSEGGIRFLVIEALPRTKIDGACFWLDDNSPVIALSMRYDRIDYFWHTVMHELGHIKNEDGLSIDKDIFSDSDDTMCKPLSEEKAGEFAVSNLVPQDDLEDYIMRVSPIYPKTGLIGFASLMNVHPGIVLGQLQHRKEISYARNRDLLVKVRGDVTSSTLTDGFGSTLPAYP